MFDEIGLFIETNPILSGVISILISVIFFIFRLGKNNSFKLRDHGVISWRLLVQTWGIVIMFFLMGIIIIIKNI